MSTDLKRTNVRLPSDVHAALKKAAIDRRQSIEQIVLRAVERELGPPSEREIARNSTELRIIREYLDQIQSMTNQINRDLKAAEMAGTTSATLRNIAGQYLESLPTPVLIKDMNGVIVWCNPACAMLVQERRTEIIGRTIREVLSLQSDDATVAHWRELKREKKNFFTEEVTIKKKKTVLLCYRFVFKTSSGHEYSGDINFLNEDLAKARETPVVLNAMAGRFSSSSSNLEPSSLVDILSSFLEHLKNVAVLKDVRGRIQWGNAPFLHLAGRTSLQEILNSTSMEIFGLPQDHEIARHESQVVEEIVAILGPEYIEADRKRLRIALRFPILGADNQVAFIGVIGTEPDAFMNKNRDSDRRILASTSK